MTRLLVAVALILLSARAVHAQPAPWEPERLTPGWTFVPALGFGGLWDSNSTLRSTGDPQLRQWVGLVNPRGEIDFNGRRTRFAAGYSGALEAYNELRQLTRYEQRGKLTAQRQVTPRLLFQTQSALSMAPTTERLELGSLPFENVGSTMFEARGGAEYAINQRTSVGADYQYQWVTFDRNVDTPGVLSGGFANSGSARVKRAIGSRLSTGGVYSYRVANTNGGVRHINVQDALGVVTMRVSRHTSVEAGAGVAHLKITDTGETRNGPSLRASVTHTVERTRLELSYQRTFVPSWTFAGTTTNEELRGSVYVPFMRGRMSVQASSAYRHNQPLASDRSAIVLDSWWSGATLGYGLARWLRVEGFYTGSFQSSSARGQVDRTRIGVQFVTLKPVRIQ
jgi:hypothetical protein